MDEQEKNNQENNNQEEVKNGLEDAAEKTGEVAKDTAEAVKDGVNLAKDIETGNYVGVAKDAVNLLNNKTVRRILLVAILIPIIIIVLLVCSLLAIFNVVGESIQNAVNGITDWVKENYMFGIIFYTDEQLDAIIESITNLGIDLDDLHLMGDIDYDKDDPDREEKEKEALKKYLVKFLVAQEKMQTLNPRPDVEWYDITDIDDIIAQKGIENAIKISDSNQELTYGNVYVHRTKDGETTTNLGNQLQYLYYDTFKEYIENKNDSVLNYFSVDENGNIVYAKKTKTTVETKKNGRKIDDESSETIEYEIESIDYKSEISKYTTSLQFFIYLTMITQNPEFASAVADLASNGEIRIMIMDNTTTMTKKVTYEYMEHTKTRQKKSEVGASEAEEEIDEEEQEVEEIEEQETTEHDGDSKIDYIDETTDTKVTEETTTIKEEKNSKLAIIYVNTWFSEQTITYQKVDKDESPEPDVQTLGNEEVPPLEEEGEVSWKTDQKITTETNYKSTQYTESVHGDVIDKTDDFIKLLDQEFKIPNTNRKESPAGNLISGADWFFELLQMDPYSQNLEQIMRIILNKYTSTDKYGDVKWADIANIFDAEMTSTGDNYIVDTTKSDSKLVITDKEVLKEAISKAFAGNSNMVKNLTDNVDNFIKMQDDYNVNAVFAIAVSVIESHAGTDTTGAVDYPRTHNWWNVTISRIPSSDYKNLFDVTEKEPNVNYYYRNPNSGNKNSWMVYNNVGEAINRFGNLIANNVKDYYFKANHYTVSEIAQDYNSDNAEYWTDCVISLMNSIYEAAGIEIQADGFIVGGVQTEEARKEIQEYIENNLIKTKVHHGDYKYQTDEYEKWWQPPYNEIKQFECPWWAYGRAYMYLEKNGQESLKDMIPICDGGEYYDTNKQMGGFAYGKTPKANSIVSWKGGTKGYGHVAYVEGVTSDGIYVSHAGNGSSWFGVQFIKDGDLASIGWSGYTLNGYIYLDEPKN